MPTNQQVATNYDLLNQTLTTVRYVDAYTRDQLHTIQSIFTEMRVEVLDALDRFNQTVLQSNESTFPMDYFMSVVSGNWGLPVDSEWRAVWVGATEDSLLVWPSWSLAVA